MPHPPIALITGGAHRVGRAISLALACAGWDIAITYRQSRDESQSLIKELHSLNRRAIAIKADFTQPAKAVKTISAKTHQFGRVQVLVNNASLYEEDSDEKSATRMWSVHVETPLLLVNALKSDLHHDGRVINMVDLQAQRPMPQYSAYCASKAALWNLTLSQARQLAPHATANGIAPGVVLWPKGYPRQEREKYLRRVPLARAGTPEDVAAAVLYLCRPNSYVTGQILILDGGRSLV